MKDDAIHRNSGRYITDCPTVVIVENLKTVLNIYVLYKCTQKEHKPLSRIPHIPSSVKKNMFWCTFVQLNENEC